VTNEEFFALFTRSAWRLEALPAYGTAESDPSFAAWLAAGGELPPLQDRPPKVAWMDAVRKAAAEGKRLGRVRLLRRPRSPYEDYELATYPENVEAGEDVRIAEVDQYPELAQLDRDFWLLDDGELALVMDYDADGRFLGLKPTRDPATLSVYRRQRDLALACSVPLAEFLTGAGT
jgi:hypothetical protein